MSEPTNNVVEFRKRSAEEHPHADLAPVSDILDIEVVRPRVRDVVVTRVVGPAVKHARTIQPVRAPVRHARFGVLGVWRLTRLGWAWATAAEFESNKATKPEMVIAQRKGRQKVAWWGIGVTAGGGYILATTNPPALAVVLAVVLFGAGVVERVLRRVGVDLPDGERPALTGEPSRKAVREAFSKAKLGKVEEISIVGPVTRTREGNAWTAVVQLPAGGTYRNATKKLPDLASAMGVGISQLAFDPVCGNEGRGLVWCADTDPLAGPPIPSPLLKLDRPFDFWNDNIPIGTDVRGRPLGASFVERTILVGGEQGGGKSVACNNYLCAMALDPTMRLLLVDGKGVDLLDYADIAETLIKKRDPAALIDLLDEVIEWMEERYDLMGRLRVKKITPGIAEDQGLYPTFLHIDELATFTKSDAGPEITEKLRDVVSRGRAAAIITSAATQRPSSKVIDTDLRDLMQIRIALRCTTNNSSDMILSQGWAAAGFSAKDIDMEQRGAGLILHEGSQPVRMRTNMLTDPQIAELCRRAYRLREKAGTLPKSDARPLPRLLRAMLTIMGGDPQMHTDRLLSGLSERWAEYDGWDATTLARALPEGVRAGGSEQVRAIASDGVERPRNGYRREDLQRALDRA